MPLYEAKMIHLYDTRWATYEPDGSVRDVTPEEKRDPNFHVMPRYWVHEGEVNKKLASKWDKSWMLGWRRIARSTDERTMIATLLPSVASGDSVFLMLPGHTDKRRALLLQAALSSFVLDFAARQKLGGTNANFFMIEQLPVPTAFGDSHVVEEIVDRLNSQHRPAGDSSGRRAEIEARMLRLYGIARDEADYILETFPIVKRKDIATYGEFRTKRLILESYDRLSEVSA